MSRPIAVGPTLTARELEVLELIANGFTYAEIAEQLSTGVDGAKGAGRRMMMRLGALNAPHAVLLGCRAGLIDVRPHRPSGARGPVRMPLTPRQAAVLATASDGAPLTEVAARLGITRPQVAARLSEAYTRLGVTHLPRGQRRAAAVTVARRRGLIPAATSEKDAA